VLGEIPAARTWLGLAAETFQLPETSFALVSPVGWLINSGTTGVEIALSDAASAEARSPPVVGGAVRGSWGATVAAASVGAEVSAAGKTAGRTAERTAMIGSDTTGWGFASGAENKGVAGIPVLATAVGATAADTSGVRASTGVAAVGANIPRADERWPFRTGREPEATTGFVPSVLAGEISEATAGDGAGRETRSATGTDRSVAEVERLASITDGTATGTVTSDPDKTGSVSTAGAGVPGVTAAGSRLAAADMGEGTGSDTSAADAGNGETGTGVGTATLADRAALISPEAESVEGNWMEEAAADVPRPIGSP